MITTGRGSKKTPTLQIPDVISVHQRENEKKPPGSYQRVENWRLNLQMRRTRKREGGRRGSRKGKREKGKGRERSKR